MEKDILIAKVKFSKDGKEYEFLVNRNIKVKDLKPNQVVLVRTRDGKTNIIKNKRAILQDVKLEKRAKKDKPTAYLIKIVENSNFKLLTNKERIRLNKRNKAKRQQNKKEQDKAKNNKKHCKNVV